MEIGDVPRRIGVDGVVRGVGVRFHDLEEFVEVLGFGSGVALNQGLLRRLHERHGNPAIPFGAHDGAVVRAIDGVALLREGAVVLAQTHGDGLLFHGAKRIAVAVKQAVVLANDGFFKFVDVVHGAGGVHPASRFVEALVNEELAPGGGAIGVQPLIAFHVGFVAKVEGGVGVDEQEGVAAFALQRRNGKAVGAHGGAR